MRKFITTILATVLAIGSFALLGTRASAQGNAPQWTIGDYWEYTGSVVLSGTTTTMVLKIEVKEKTTVTEGTTTSEAYRCDATLSMVYMGASMSVPGNYYVKAGNIASIKVDFSYVSLQFNMGFDPPIETVRFPLSNGQTWTSSSQVRMTSYGYTDYQNVSVEPAVSGPESTTVPAGTFSAFVVDERVQGVTFGRMYYSDSVGFYVKLELSAMGMSSLALELKSYRYQKAGSELTVILLSVVLIIVVVAAVVVALLWRASRRARMPTQMPPQWPPQAPPQGQPQWPPSGQPPQQPPYQPPPYQPPPSPPTQP